MSATAAGPWYRQFWPWFIMAFPATAVVAGIITAFIAFNGADGLVSDDYYKQGLAINRTLARADAAIARGLSGTVARDGETVVVKLSQTADNAAPLPALVRVRFVHPTRASEDRIADATRSANGDYVARIAIAPGMQWHAVVDTAEWRLEGSLSVDARSATLAPH